MILPKTIAAAAFVALLGTAPASAQQGSTSAGPAQDQERNVAASTVPNDENAASGGAMTRGAGITDPAGAAAGTVGGGPGIGLANPGGGPSR